MLAVCLAFYLVCSLRHGQRHARDSFPQSPTRRARRMRKGMHGAKMRNDASEDAKRTR